VAVKTVFAFLVRFIYCEPIEESVAKKYSHWCGQYQRAESCQFRIGRLIDWFGITFDLYRIL